MANELAEQTNAACERQSRQSLERRVIELEAELKAMTAHVQALETYVLGRIAAVETRIDLRQL